MAHYNWDDNRTYNNCEICEDLVMVEDDTIYCSRYQNDNRCIHGTPLSRNKFSGKIISLNCCWESKR